MSADLSWFPVWALWILLPWLALHLYYDFSISADLRKQRKQGDQSAARSFGLFRYKEVMRENTRRFESGDPLARLVTYYDWFILAGFFLLLSYRMLFK